MYFVRRAKLNLDRTLKAFFEDASFWNNAFTVYGFSDMSLPEASLTRPCVFILDAGINFRVRHLPTIVIYSIAEPRDYDLGRKLALCQFSYNVYGRTRGERDDLAGSIMVGISQINIHDFDTVGEPIDDTRELVPDDSGGYWNHDMGDISNELAIDATLANWTSVSSMFWMDYN
jgi:hypothetical protein